MKAISLWQPYAALIALGFKKIETRSWPTTYRGPLAIHAAQKTMPYIEPALRSQMEKQIGMNILDLREAELLQRLILSVFPSGHSEKNLKDLIGASKVLK